MDVKQLYTLIERLDVFEEKYQIIFENISVQFIDKCPKKLWVFYELRSSTGNELNLKYIEINCTIYSNSGEIMDTKSNTHSSNLFWGFEIDGYEFEFENDNDIMNIGKIRIYPQ